MLSRQDLQALAQQRLDDAMLLLNNGRNSSAYYLAGYAVELALKACISRLFQADMIPDKSLVNAIYTHDLNHLMGIAGLTAQFRADMDADPQLAAFWGITNNWTEASRYEVWDAVAATNLLQAINDPDHGVFQWVRQHW